MNHRKSASATFASNGDPVCWTEMPSLDLDVNKGKSRKWLQEEPAKESYNERLDLESFSSFSFTTINSNNERLSNGRCGDSTSEEGSMRTPVRRPSLFHPTMLRQLTPRRLKNCTFTRSVNSTQHRNKPSSNTSYCYSGKGDAPSSLIFSERDTKPPSSMVGITLPDYTTEAAETSCSNTTVASGSSSSSESYLAMEIFSTGSSCFCTDDYINLPCSTSINSSKSTLDAEDMTTISDSPLSTSTSNSSYNDKGSCDNTKKSNRTCDEESAIHQSTDNGSRAEAGPEPHIHYLPKHWRENDCTAVKDDNNSTTSAPLFIGKGYYCFDKVSSCNTTQTNTNTMVGYPTVLTITTQTNSVLPPKAAETLPPSDLRKLPGGTRTRIQHERRRPLRFCSLPITTREEATCTSPNHPVSVRLDTTRNSVKDNNHIPLDVKSSPCDAIEPKVYPKENSLSPEEEMLVCNKAERVSGSIVPSEQKTAIDNQGGQLASSMTNRSTCSNDRSDGCCSMKDSVNTGTTEDTNYDNASSSTIQTDNFDDFLGMYRWDDQPHLRRKKLLRIMLFLLIAAAAVIAIVVPISVSRSRPRLVEATTNVTSQHVTSNDDENRSVGTSGLKPLIIGNSTKPTGSEEEYYYESSGLSSSNCRGSEAILFQHKSMLDRSNNVLLHPEFLGIISENGRRMALSSRTNTNTSDDISRYHIQIYEISPTNYNSNNYSNTTWDVIAELDHEAPFCEQCEPQVLLNEDGSLCAVVSYKISSVSSMEATMYRLETQSLYRASSSFPSTTEDVWVRKRRHHSNQPAPSQRSTTQSGIKMYEWSMIGTPLTFTARPSKGKKVSLSLSSSGYRLAVAGYSDSQSTNCGVTVFEFNNSSNSWDDQFIVEGCEVKVVELSAKGDALAVQMEGTSSSSNTHEGTPEQVVHKYYWSTFTGDWQLVRDHELTTDIYSTTLNERIEQKLCTSFNESFLFLSDAN